MRTRRSEAGSLGAGVTSFVVPPLGGNAVKKVTGNAVKKVTGNAVKKVTGNAVKKTA